MDEIISYKMCAVKVRNAKLRNYLKSGKAWLKYIKVIVRWVKSGKRSWKHAKAVVIRPKSV